MNCKYFGKCASCVLYDKSYEEQLNFKLQREKQRFSDFTTMDFDIIKSEEKAFRNRAEFRIWWEKDENGNEILSYAMNDFEKNILKIDSCQIVSSQIQEVMPKLLNLLMEDLILFQYVLLIHSTLHLIFYDKSKLQAYLLLYFLKIQRRKVYMKELIHSLINLKVLA